MCRRMQVQSGTGVRCSILLLQAVWLLRFVETKSAWTLPDCRPGGKDPESLHGRGGESEERDSRADAPSGLPTTE